MNEHSMFELHSSLRNNDDVCKWVLQKFLYVEMIKLSTSNILYYEPLLRLILQYCLQYRCIMNWHMDKYKCNATLGMSPDLAINETFPLPNLRNFTRSFRFTNFTNVTKLEMITKVRPTSIKFFDVSIDVRLCECCPRWKILNKQFTCMLSCNNNNEHKFFHPEIGYLKCLNWKIDNNNDVSFDINFQFFKNTCDF